MQIIHFFALLAILYIIHFFINTTENFTVLDQKSKQCSREAINSAYKEYIFTGPQFIR